MKQSKIRDSQKLIQLCPENNWIFTGFEDFDFGLHISLQSRWLVGYEKAA
jgi:hypothetical protein